MIRTFDSASLTDSLKEEEKTIEQIPQICIVSSTIKNITTTTNTVTSHLTTLHNKNEDKNFSFKSNDKSDCDLPVTTKRLIKKFASHKPKPESSNTEAKRSKKDTSQLDSSSSTKSKDETAAKTFKRTINKKKLTPRLQVKAKQHLEAENSIKKAEKSTSQATDLNEDRSSEKLEFSTNQAIAESPKREIVLIKDENYGFGFIAGSEKPLVIRFVSQGKFSL